MKIDPGLWNAACNFENHPECYSQLYPEENADHNQWYGYGNYYSWYSATVGLGIYNISNGAVVAGDICPNDWSLPIGGSASNTDGSFSYLDVRLGGSGSSQDDNEEEETVSNRWRSYPNNFIYAGFWQGSAAFGRGNGGEYWSRTASTLTMAHSLRFHYNGIIPDAVSYKYRGVTIRCLTQ